MAFISNYKSLNTFIVLVLFFFSTVEAQGFYPDRHYKILENPTATTDPTKVEVVEVFWLACNHCYAFERHIDAWKKELPDYAVFSKSPVVSGFHSSAQTHARLFYSAKALGMEEEIVKAAFSAIHREGRLLAGTTELEYFFQGFGIPREKYKSVSESFGVENSIRQADQRAKKWEIRGVPTVIVNGKYQVSTTRQIGLDKVLEIVDYLIQKEKRFLTSSP